MLWIGLPIIMTKVIDAPTNTKNSSQESMCDQKIERLTIMIALGMQLMIGLLVKLIPDKSFFDCALIASFGKWEIHLAASSHLKPRRLVKEKLDAYVTADTEDLDEKIRLFASKAP